MVDPCPRISRRFRPFVIQILQHRRLVGLVDVVGSNGIDLEWIGVVHVEIEARLKRLGDQRFFTGRQTVPRGPIAGFAAKVGGAALSGLQAAAGGLVVGRGGSGRLSVSLLSSNSRRWLIAATHIGHKDTAAKRSSQLHQGGNG